MKRSLTCAVIVAIVAMLGVHEGFAKPAKKRLRKPNGIYVGAPKVYDDRSLQTLLSAAAARLSQLNPFDQTSLIAHLGATQGANVTQTQFAFQANGLPTPGITTTANNAAPNTVTTVDNGTAQKAGATAPDTTTDNKTVTNGATGTLQTQSTAPQVSPSPAALPSAPAFALPSNFQVSSLNILNEQTQLNAEVTNLQLLLQGSLSDELERGGESRKRRITIGFPISVSVPTEYQYRSAVAEVEISVCNPSGSFNVTDPPSLVTVLPKERTYNVAGIVSSSASVGGGVVAGVANLSAGFLRGHQTFYLTQDQDTLAIQRAPRGQCLYQRYKNDTKTAEETVYGSPLTFAWQFRPVLGRKTVQDGMRQTFVELAFPSGVETSCSARLNIRSGWRHFDSGTGRVGDWVEPPDESTVSAANFQLVPIAKAIMVDDNGDGTLTIRAEGDFPAGTRVRIGNVVQDESTIGFEHNPQYIKFTAPALALAISGAALVNRDGAEAPVVPGDNSSQLPDCARLLEPPAPNGVPQTALGPQPDLAVLATHRVNFSQGKKGATYFITVSNAGSAPTSGKVTATDTLPIGLTAASISGAGWNCTLNSLTCTREDVLAATASYAPITLTVNVDDNSPVSVINTVSVSGGGETNTTNNSASDTTTVSPGVKVATVVPFSDSTGLVTLNFAPPDSGAKPDVAIAVIGSRVFGLKDAPFISRDDHSVSFVVPNDLLKANVRVIWKRLFSDVAEQTYKVPITANFSISAIALVSSSDSVNTYAVTGTGLNSIRLLVPKEVKIDIYGNGTSAVFSLKKEQFTGLKNVILQNADLATPLILSLPTGSPPDVKPSLDKHAPIGAGDKSLVVTGSLLENILVIHYLEKPVPFALSNDKKSLTIQLPDGFSTNTGIQVLEFVYADKTSVRFEVPVQKK